MNKRIVVLGFLGTQLDGGKGSGRWEKWRPSVAITQYEDVSVDRFELLCNAPHIALAELVKQDMQSTSPETTVNLHSLPISDAWDFEDMYGCLYDFAQSYQFNPEEEEYWVHITTGTHVAQICLFLMTEARYFPGRLLQTSPPKRQGASNPGDYALIDLDLSRYDQIAQRFSNAQREGVELDRKSVV